MLNRDKTILKKFVHSLASIKEIKKITVFGSRVRGDFHENSDLDMLIVVTKKDKLIRNRINHIAFEYEFKNEISLSTIILSEYEYEVNAKMGSPFIKNVEQEGIVVYEPDNARKK